MHSRLRTRVDSKLTIHGLVSYMRILQNKLCPTYQLLAVGVVTPELTSTRFRVAGVTAFAGAGGLESAHKRTRSRSAARRLVVPSISAKLKPMGHIRQLKWYQCTRTKPSACE